jgi:hypothetical protein
MASYYNGGVGAQLNYPVVPTRIAMIGIVDDCPSSAAVAVGAADP